MNYRIVKYIILAVSIITILASSVFLYRVIFPPDPPVISATELALQKIEGKIAGLESSLKEAKKNAYMSTQKVETEVSALAPDDVAVELSALLRESRSERRDRVRSEGVELPD